MKDVDTENNREFHISFDIDVLDRVEAPSTGYACTHYFHRFSGIFVIHSHSFPISVAGGMTLREAICAVETVFESGRLTGLDIVEINPEIGTDADVKCTADSAIALFKAACGTNRNGNLPLEAHLPGPNSN